VPSATPRVLVFSAIVFQAGAICSAQSGAGAGPIAATAAAASQKAIVLEAPSPKERPMIRISGGADPVITDAPPLAEWQRLQQWPIRAAVELTLDSTTFSVGVSGERGNSTPAHFADTISGSPSALPPIRAFANLSGQMTWNLQAHVEHALRKEAGGNSVTFLGDAWIPFGGTASGAGPHHTSATRAKAQRARVRFSF
jgi:hypothetical protein